MSKQRWIDEVKAALEESRDLSLEEYRDGLQEILEDTMERYELAEADIERAEEEAEDE